MTQHLSSLSLLIRLAHTEIARRSTYQLLTLGTSFKPPSNLDVRTTRSSYWQGRADSEGFFMFLTTVDTERGWMLFCHGCSTSRHLKIGFFVTPSAEADTKSESVEVRLKLNLDQPKDSWWCAGVLK